MRDSRPRSIDRLFNDAAEEGHMPFLKIHRKLVILLKFNQIVKALLPVALRPWCRVANVNQNMIALETANAGWKMRLRYEQRQLLFALQKQILPSLSSINIKINPSLEKIDN